MPVIEGRAAKPSVADRLAAVARREGVLACDLPGLHDWPCKAVVAALRKAGIERSDMTTGICRQADRINQERTAAMIDRFNTQFEWDTRGGFWVVPGDPARDPALNRELAERLVADKRLSRSARERLAPILTPAPSAEPSAPTQPGKPRKSDEQRLLEAQRRDERRTSVLNRREKKALVAKIKALPMRPPSQRGAP
jgi:hypothetical protein